MIDFKQVRFCGCGSDSYWADSICMKCRGRIPFFSSPAKPKVYKEVEMPEKMDGEGLWKHLPWKNITIELAKKFGWYFSDFGDCVRLIMPIFRKGKPIFYSSRLMVGEGRKYKNAENTKKEYWLSSDFLTTKGPVFLCEGVADAVYMSQLGNSVALLGLHYDGSLDKMLRGREIIIALDGDFMGKSSSSLISFQLTNLAKRVRILIMDEDKDPTDLTLEQLRAKINETS